MKPEMMLIAVLFTLLCTLFCTAAEEHAVPKKPYDLYLLIGQSNMAGRGTPDEESTQIHPRVFMLNKAEQWVPATDPVHFDKSFAGVGPGLAFGKAMAEANPQANIGLIPCAVGGTSITLWLPGVQDPTTKAYPYDDTLRRMKTALKDGALKGIIWHQGETDRNPDAMKLHAARLTELIARLRKDLNAPDVPFIAGELPDFHGTSELNSKFNAVLHSLEASVANYTCISAADFVDNKDNLHLDTRSARTFGLRYALAMVQMQAKIGLR